MISVKLQGRLGNQMFQYAFANSLSNKLKTIYFLDAKEICDLIKYFKLNKWDIFISKIYSYRIIQKIINKLFLKRQFIQIGHEYPNDIAKQFSNNTQYSVFCQSASYFNNSMNKIHQYFTVKSIYVDMFKWKYSKIFDNHKVIVVHFRIGDYLEFGNESLGGKNLILPSDYYDKCFSMIDSLDNYKVIFISDSIEEIIKRYNKKDNFLFESNNDIIDFLLLINADKLIISNSSFAWWGAYLNIKKAKVYAPRYWLGFKIKKEYPVGIYNNLNWELVEIN